MMIGLKIGGPPPPPQTNKTEQLDNKVLALAETLLTEELFNGTAFACGNDFTCRLMGMYGSYETINGEVIAFQPKNHLEFVMICDDFIIIDQLAMIRTVAHHVDDYDLEIARA